MKQKTKKGLIITAIVLAVILVAYLIIALLPRPQSYDGTNPMRKDSELPILIAHGGGNREFPDNTLEAFYNAYSVDNRVMMETDVSITKDGVVILSHDTTLDRKTNVTGSIADWNYSDLIANEVDFGYTNETDDDDKLVEGTERVHFVGEDGKEKYPTDVSYPDGVTPRHETVFLATTLEELIVAFPNNRINVEIKQSGDKGIECATAVLELLRKHNAFDRVVLASFHSEIFDLYKQWQADGTVPEGFMYSPETGGMIKYIVLSTLGLDVFYGDRVAVFQIPMEEYGFNLAKESLVNNAHDHNIAVQYWTINDIEDMKHLIDIGADGIMTDYPHRLKEVYNSYTPES